MRITNLMVLALLALTITAAAQQSASTPQNSQAAQTAQGSTLAQPTTMDQVVDRVIIREKDLIKFLAPRTPIVET